MDNYDNKAEQILRMTGGAPRVVDSLNGPREVRMYETASKILSSRLQTAHQLVSGLEDRLEPVCRRQSEQTGLRVSGGSAPPPIGGQTPLADVFNHLEVELSVLLERLDRLANRIEL
jgi:hypothetical protein